MIYDLKYMVEFLGLDLDDLEVNLKKYNSYVEFNEDDLVKKGYSIASIRKIENDLFEGYNRYKEMMDLIGEKYLDKIFKEEFIVSIEDIAILFDVSIRYATTEIAPLLDKIVFPEVKFNIKDRIKENVYQYMSSRTSELKNFEFLIDNYSDNYIGLNNNEGIKDILRKKVLFNIYDLIEYCKNNVVLESSFIPIYMPKFMVDTQILSNRWNYNKNLSYQNMIKDSFDKFLDFKIKQNNYKSKENNFDFEIFLKSFVIGRKFKDYFQLRVTPMKSLASLRILFEKVYNTEILRMIDNKAMRVLSFRVGKEKKYMRRYILDRDDIREQFDNSNIADKNTMYKFKIKEDILRNLFNSNVDGLIVEYNKFLEQKATH